MCAKVDGPAKVLYTSLSARRTMPDCLPEVSGWVYPR